MPAHTPTTRLGVVILHMLFCLVITIQSASAQSIERIDSLLDQEAATYGNTAYLVLLAAGMVPEDASPEESVEALKSLDWGFDHVDADAAVSFGSLSLMIMKGFDMNGGIMYSIFHNRRYAAKELVFLEISRTIVSPYHHVSGADVMTVLGRTLEYLETP